MFPDIPPDIKVCPDPPVKEGWYRERIQYIVFVGIDTGKIAFGIKHTVAKGEAEGERWRFIDDVMISQVTEFLTARSFLVMGYLKAVLEAESINNRVGYIKSQARLPGGFNGR